jgi:glycosyltransferase involved in cell wall biosynthesis
MHRTLVIIPALNEAESIARVVEEIDTHVADSDVLVIDDGSTDGTAAIARAAGARVVTLPFNVGVGTALRTGFRYANRHGYDRVVQTDGDGQHDPSQIPVLLEHLDDGADLVIGSRFLARDGHYVVERSRGAAMQILRVATRILLGRSIHDSTYGFRAFSKPLIAQFSTTYPREFLSDTVEALLMASYSGRSVVEVPVTMRYRTTGTPSHTSFRLMYHYVRLLTVMGMTASLKARAFNKQRQRI